MNREQILRWRIKALTRIFIIGLAISGATAVPLQTEVNWLAKFTGAEKLAAKSAGTPIWALWLVKGAEQTIQPAGDSGSPATAELDAPAPVQCSNLDAPLNRSHPHPLRSTL